MASIQTVSKSGKKLAPSVAAGKFPPKPPVKASAKASVPPPPAPKAETVGTPVKRGPGRPPKNKPAELAEQLHASVEATKPVAPKAAGNGANEAALVTEINSLKGQLAKLQELVAKTKQGPVARKADEIASEFNFVDGDWREQYHGARITVKPFSYDRKNDGIRLLDKGSNIANCLLAMPRDNDPGNAGAKARNSGQIAVYWECSEDGESYFGAPAYVTVDELAEIWVD